MPEPTDVLTDRGIEGLTYGHSEGRKHGRIDVLTYLRIEWQPAIFKYV